MRAVKLWFYPNLFYLSGTIHLVTWSQVIVSLVGPGKDGVAVGVAMAILSGGSICVQGGVKKDGNLMEKVQCTSSLGGISQSRSFCLF